MKVLIGCEESQIVCMAFRERGHEAYSCDIQDCSGGHPEWHIKDDVLKHLNDGWDLMIGHPPCTYISYAGTSSWNNPGRIKLRLDALDFFRSLWETPIEKICLENPRGCASPTIAKYSQEIQPYYFGDSESKKTWLWLKNLPKLKHINGTDLFENNTHVSPKIYAYYKKGKKKGQPIYGNNYLKFSEDRGIIRSKTFPGIAKAMAEQWG
jgi:site-specific DNA-cytosine methylase